MAKAAKKPATAGKTATTADSAATPSPAPAATATPAPAATATSAPAATATPAPIVPAARRPARVARGADAAELLARLAQALPEPRCELDFADAWQLLVATILSAQSTDARVNLVTPALFRRWPTPAALGAATQEEVEVVVKSTGFFRNKARAIREASQAIAESFGGEVPRDMDAVMSLRGVARKTANLVLGTAYGLPTGIIVDTHAARVALRLGLTRATDPQMIEHDLCAVAPREEWVATGHRFVLHGRYVCTARTPLCGECPLNELCPARVGEPQGKLAERSAAEARRVARGLDGAD
jgi:endonuclease-3